MFPISIRLGKIEKDRRTIPFIISCDNNLPMQFKIYVRIKNGTKKLFPKSKYYTGKKAWNFNPRQSIVGYLVLPDGINFKKRLEIQVRAEATDGVYLPHGYTWLPFQNEFYLEPSTDFEE